MRELVDAFGGLRGQPLACSSRPAAGRPRSPGVASGNGQRGWQPEEPDVASLPFLQLEPAGDCNLRCRMCSLHCFKDIPAAAASPLLDPALMTRVLDQLPGLRELHLQGLGEPLLHPSFTALVAVAAGRGLAVSTKTNLTLLAADGAEELLTCGLESLHVSLDGASPRTYHYVRRGAHFARVISHIELLVRTRRALAAKGVQPLPRICLVYVVMKTNLSEMPLAVMLGQRLGVDSLHFRNLYHSLEESVLPDRCLPMRDFVQLESVRNESLKRVERYFRETSELARHYGFDVRVPRPPRREAAGDAARCDWPRRGMCVAWDGSVMPCSMIGSPDRLNFGSLADRSVDEIWNDPEYRDFRRRLDAGPAPDICRSCALYRGEL